MLRILSQVCMAIIVFMVYAALHYCDFSSKRCEDRAEIRCLLHNCSNNATATEVLRNCTRSWSVCFYSSLTLTRLSHSVTELCTVMYKIREASSRFEHIFILFEQNFKFAQT